jgi:plasmid stabilization system protein ParE
MKSGYEVAWTEHALAELNEIFLYLESNFSDKEIGRLSKQLESTLRNISTSPALYPASRQRSNIHRAVVSKFNTLYYRVNIEKNQIEILSCFSNRMDPGKLDI